MKNFIKIFPHIIIWAIVLIVPIYLISREGTFDYKPYYNYVIRMGIFAILFYANYSYLIRKYLFNRKFTLYIIINIMLIAVLVVFQALLSEYMKPAPEAMKIVQQGIQDRPRHYGKPPMVMRVIFDYVSIIFVIGLAVAIKTTIRWYRDSINLEKAKSVQLEADLRNLRSQLNPHFLFNTLNNIYSLIAIDQSRAQDAVHRLSKLLRYVMYDNDVLFVPLDKELEFTRNYIDLMKLRLSPEVKLNVLIENKGSHDMIASLMFITLIENAFKHGINNGSESFIDISILVDPGIGVLCTVENSLVEKEQNMEEKNSGIGLANLSKRLALLYPHKHEFIAEKRTDSFFTLLRIDFRKEITES
ncbi:sensor histidine kinase [Prevotella sp. 10(H)]|uniref:sensor histidine kinase n=1 Tax=Prevotella sp. 10(H) TaxID=1158294 RepID=UPI0004A6CD5F|nr:histidine kinase [Prevotella sp. 10(H)]